MTGAKITVTGDEVLARTLQSAARQLQDFTPVNAAAAARVAQDAAARAPRRTGRLAGSIRPTSDKTGAVIVAGGGGVAYAKVQEYGSAARNIAAQPYLRPAFAELRGDLIGLYDKQLKDAIGQVRGA